MEKPEKPKKRVKKSYIIKSAIGSGSFSEIYVAEDQNGEKVAVKFDRKDTDHRSHLYDESRYLKLLKKTKGIPRCIWFGQVQNEDCIFMELLGPDLSTLFKWCNKRFTERTVTHIAIQAIDVLRRLHEKGIIHRDIKPQNLVTGRWPKDCRSICLIDFGLSMSWRGVNGQQRPHAHPGDDGSSGKITGTVKYCSINAHRRDYSRRDDLLGLGYVLIYFLKNGKLPWSKIGATTIAERNYKIMQIKEENIPEKICEGLPREYTAYMENCCELSRTDTPDYDHLIQIFKSLVARKQWNTWDKLDWEKTEYIATEWPKY